MSNLNEKIRRRAEEVLSGYGLSYREGLEVLIPEDSMKLGDKEFADLVYDKWRTIVELDAALKSVQWSRLGKGIRGNNSNVLRIRVESCVTSYNIHHSVDVILKLLPSTAASMDDELLASAIKSVCDLLQ